MAARILGVSYDKLKKNSQKGTFPAIKVNGNWRIGKETLINYIEGGETGERKSVNV